MRSESIYFTGEGNFTISSLFQKTDRDRARESAFFKDAVSFYDHMRQS